MVPQLMVIGTRVLNNKSYLSQDDWNEWSVVEKVFIEEI